ncbi:MAG: redoxin domain-containing protein [Betaproteobacteria bacterium]|nr:redoxin domain-containing protein [Betaproteobacteria bacterium]
MYLSDFKRLFIYMVIAAGSLLVSAAALSQSVFAGRTALSVAASPTKLPDFELANLSGGTLKSADIKGKVIVIRFWATW